MNKECRNNIINDLGKIMQSFEDRLASKRLPLAERYLKRRLKILADFDVCCGGEAHKYQAIFYRADMQVIDGDKRAAGIKHLEILNSDVMSCRDESLMFVGNIEIVDSPKHFIPTLVRLQRPNYLNDIFSGAVYVPFFDATLKSVGTFTEGEIDICRITTIQLDKLRSQKIESGAQVVNGVTYDDSKIMRNLIPNPKGPEVIRGIRVLLDNNTVRFRFDVINDTVIKLNDVAFGPINL